MHYLSSIISLHGKSYVDYEGAAPWTADFNLKDRIENAHKLTGCVPRDYSEFFKTSRDYALTIYDNAPDDIKQIFSDILWSLLMKMNIPVAEAQDAIAQLEVGGMGYLFENAEKMDIQAERKNTKEQRERAEAAEQKATIAEHTLELFIIDLIQNSKASGKTKEEIQGILQSKYGIEDADAKNKVEKHWN